MLGTALAAEVFWDDQAAGEQEPHGPCEQPCLVRSAQVPVNPDPLIQTEVAIDGQQAWIGDWSAMFSLQQEVEAVAVEARLARLVDHQGGCGCVVGREAR